MNLKVSLTKQLKTFVDRNVKSGMYESSSEVIRDGLRLLKERERAGKDKLKQLKADIDLGIASLDRGERIDGEEVFAKIQADLEKRAKQKK